MVKFYTFFGLVASTFLLISFSPNPPDGKTGAPGDSFCQECHNSTNPPNDGTITVEGFPENITPLDTYQLTVVNRNTIGDAVRGGFQMTILGPFNTKAGKMERPSANSAIANAMGRQYFEHHPAVEYPDSNVLRWTVNWIAPELTGSGVITWYISGNIANGDFKETGDRIVNATGKGTIILSAAEDISSQQPLLYPNPGNDDIFVSFKDNVSPDGLVVFYDLTGTQAGEAPLKQGRIHCPDLLSGLYILEIHQGVNSSVTKWSKQ